MAWAINIFFKLPEARRHFMNIDEVLTLLRKFSFLLNCLLYEVVRPLILIRKRNLGSLIALKYIILRTGSGLKLLFLAKMAFRVIFVFRTATRMRLHHPTN